MRSQNISEDDLTTCAYNGANGSDSYLQSARRWPWLNFRGMNLAIISWLSKFESLLINRRQKESAMKPARFNELTLVDKAWLVSEFGALLLSIEYYDHRIHLFSLNSHFIEMYQNLETRQIDRISVASYKDIDKYLPRIIIGSLKIKK